MNRKGHFAATYAACWKAYQHPWLGKPRSWSGLNTEIGRIFLKTNLALLGNYWIAKKGHG